MTLRSRPPKPRTSLAAYLSAEIAASPKTQRAIASEIGYRNPNIITMFKRGHTKIPIEKIPHIAVALEIDEVALMRKALEEYMPATAQAIFSALGEPISSNEMMILAHIRDASGETDPPLTTRLRDAISDVLT